MIIDADAATGSRCLMMRKDRREEVRENKIQDEKRDGKSLKRKRINTGGGGKVTEKGRKCTKRGGTEKGKSRHKARPGQQ